MPGKFQHGKSKKKRAKQRAAAGVTPQQAVAQIPRAATTVTSAPPVRLSAHSPKMSVVRYPYVAAELRSIGILSGIIIAILIVLAVILS